MVYVIRDHSERRYGYQLMGSTDGVQRMLSESAGFGSPTDVMSYVKRLGDAIKAGHAVVVRDREATGTYGYQIYEEAVGPQGPLVLDEAYGWLDDSEVRQHVQELQKAIDEGMKTFL